MFQNLGHHFSTSVLTKAQSVTCLFGMYSLLGGLPDGSDGKESACNAGGPDSIPGSGRSPGEEMATHSSILAWEIPWTEESNGLQSMEVTKESDTT